MQNKVNCYKCKYFFVTYEQQRPYGCKAHGFKSPQMPSVVVFQSSSMDCVLFTPKANAK
ncbi:MAG: uracil-DNA glycosylase [Campylobacterales bacterium]|nr:uracil-DNA glycosylase [Campylobacterales bacterium]